MPGSLLNATMRTEVCWRTGPGILAAPAAHVALRRGCDIMADVVRPTLGPTPRCVAVQDIASGRPIEILDDAATILRRIIEITDPYANMGAMLLRHAAWQTWEAVGDGAAITAVLFQAILQQTAPYLAAGGDPITLRHGLERALAAVLTALRALAKPLRGSDEIARAAEAMCHDQDLATLLGEILDIVGADGYVQVEDGFTAGLDRQYVEGVHWDEGYLSRYFVTDRAAQEAWLEDPAILVSDLHLRAADQLIPLLERLAQAERRSLLVIAEEVTGSALGLLVANHQRGTLRTVAVKAPSQGTHRADILEDLAILTGGRVVTAVSGAQAQGVTLADLGRARRAWAKCRYLRHRGGLRRSHRPPPAHRPAQDRTGGRAHGGRPHADPGEAGQTAGRRGHLACGRGHPNAAGGPQSRGPARGAGAQAGAARGCRARRRSRVRGLPVGAGRVNGRGA